MNIDQLMTIRAGGPGSGPSTPCPQCGPSHKLEPGDVVKTKAEVKMWNQKTGNIDVIPVGSKVKLVNVLHKVGDTEQMISVNLGKHHDPEYMKLKDVELHKLGSKEQVEDIKPVPNSQVQIKFKTADGVDVTWIRPHTEKEKDPETMKTISAKSHYLKGEFSRFTTIKGIQDRPGYTRYSRIYETSMVPKHLQKGSGATVWLDSYTRKGKIAEVKISEQNYTSYNQKTRGLMVFSYKNAAEAVGMLKTRYGIKTTLARLRG